jgi:catechol 2,3-dioxygenase-like lactoylglutathione lyase family enzyme
MIDFCWVRTLQEMKLMKIFLLIVTLLVAPATDSSPALAGIAHVAFRVTDVPKSREFYQKLGFEEAFAFNDPGKPPVSYMKINDRQFIELYGRSDDSQALGLTHVCYEASDIESVRNAYLKTGLNPPEAKKARAGNLLFMFHDPENQLLEYTQYMPGSLHFEDRGKHLAEHRVSGHLIGAAISVHDVAAERAFYESKLSFEDAGHDGVSHLRLPGESGEQIELETSSPTTKPRILFSIGDVRQASEELLKHGLAVKKESNSVSVVDPDGAVIVFTVTK